MWLYFSLLFSERVAIAAPCLKICDEPVLLRSLLLLGNAILSEPFPMGPVQCSPPSIVRFGRQTATG